MLSLSAYLSVFIGCVRSGFNHIVLSWEGVIVLLGDIR